MSSPNEMMETSSINWDQQFFSPKQGHCDDRVIITTTINKNTGLKRRTNIYGIVCLKKNIYGIVGLGHEERKDLCREMKDVYDY